MHYEFVMRSGELTDSLVLSVEYLRCKNDRNTHPDIASTSK